MEHSRAPSKKPAASSEPMAKFEEGINHDERTTRPLQRLAKGRSRDHEPASSDECYEPEHDYAAAQDPGTGPERSRGCAYRTERRRREFLRRRRPERGRA